MARSQYISHRVRGEDRAKQRRTKSVTLGRFFSAFSAFSMPLRETPNTFLTEHAEKTELNRENLSTYPLAAFSLRSLLSLCLCEKLFASVRNSSKTHSQCA